VEIGLYNPSIHAFLGTVGSLQAKSCGGDRLIEVWKRNPGTMSGTFGTTRSKQGQWRLDVNAPAGTYYATAAKKTVRNNAKHKHICKSDTSPDFTVP
jgi:hypothetical protein